MSVCCSVQSCPLHSIRPQSVYRIPSSPTFSLYLRIVITYRDIYAHEQNVLFSVFFRPIESQSLHIHQTSQPYRIPQDSISPSAFRATTKIAPVLPSFHRTHIVSSSQSNPNSQSTVPSKFPNSYSYCVCPMLQFHPRLVSPAFHFVSSTTLNSVNDIHSLCCMYPIP